MGKSCLCLFLALLVGPLISARVEVITVSVEGEGATSEEAITVALAAAVAQVHGMDLQVTNESRTSAREVFSGAFEGEELVSEMQRWVRTSTRGLISGFEITQREGHSGWHRVHARVELPRLQNSPSAQRVRAAISGIQFDSGRLRPESIRLLEDSLSMYLTQTRRFAVLDRASAAEIARERDRIRAPDTAREEQVRLGRELAADLLVTGHLERFELREERFSFQSGRELSRFHPEAVLSLRVIDLATGEVRFARQIKTQLEAFAGGKDQWDLPLANSLAHTAVRSILDAVFPITVVHAEAESVYLNTGGDILSVGDVLDVFALDGQLRDPYTGERLGPIERRVGQIRVMSVSDKISIASVLEEVSSIGPNAICRPSGNSGLSAESKAPETPSSTQSSKVHLGDDTW